MKPFKDLAEHLAKDNRINMRAFERFNYYIEAIRATTAQHRDYLNRLSSNAGNNPYLTSLVINIELFLEKMDAESIVPRNPESETHEQAIRRVNGIAEPPSRTILGGGKTVYELDRERLTNPPPFAKWPSEDIREAIQEGRLDEAEVRSYFQSLRRYFTPKRHAVKELPGPPKFNPKKWVKA